MIFKNREEAGQKLAKKLLIYKKEKPLIFAIPRGGVVIGFEAAKVLKAPLKLVIVRKLPAPLNSELGIGAIAKDVMILDHDIINRLGLLGQEVKAIANEERKELARRMEKYDSKYSLKDARGRVVILVDDGFATGVSAKAAIKALKLHKPKKIIIAVPVCSYETAQKLKKEVDKFICLEAPKKFWAVGMWYANFPQLTDEEVIYYLDTAKNFSKGQKKLK